MDFRSAMRPARDVFRAAFAYCCAPTTSFDAHFKAET
jgi:hypothetical protein